MLAQWMYFWDWDGISTAPVIVPPYSIVPGQDQYGARGNDYRPLPEDYWQDRKKIIQEDKRDPTKVFEVPANRDTPNPQIVAQIDQLTEHRNLLAANLLKVPDIAALTEMSGRIRNIDTLISRLHSKKFD